MLKLTKPRLRRSNVVLDSLGGCVADAAKEFSRAPEMSFSKMPSEPRMFFEKLKGGITFKQLKSHTNTHGRGHFNKQMDVVNSDMKFVNLESSSVSNLSEEKFTIHFQPVKFERVFCVFNFPDKVESILSEAVFSGFQIHFLSPETLIRNKVLTMFNVYFEEPSISAPYINISTELNIGDGDSSQNLKVWVSSPWM